MDESLRVDVEHAGEVAVVRAAGEVDVSTAAELGDRLAEAPAEAAKLVVDLSGVTFIDSTGLGILVAALKRCRDADPSSSLRLVVSRPEINKIFEVTGLDAVFSLHTSLEQALAS